MRAMGRRVGDHLLQIINPRLDLCEQCRALAELRRISVSVRTECVADLRDLCQGPLPREEDDKHRLVDELAGMRVAYLLGDVRVA